MSKLRVATRLFLQSSPPIFRGFCTETVTETPAIIGAGENILFQELLRVARPNVTETDIAEAFTQCNQTPYRFLIVTFANKFRNLQHFNIALKLLRWMETSDVEVKNSDRALVIDLLCTTEGIESAEKYFDDLQQSEKTDKTYGTLFNCYCREKNLDKALELFEKIKELGFASTLTYNNLISLCTKIGQSKLAPSLVKEMEQTSVSLNIYTYNMLINSYTALKDLDVVEDVLEMMKRKGIVFDWFTYGNLANIYIDSGLRVKACTILNHMKKEKYLHNEEAFRIMININARLKSLSGIYSAWESLKSSYPTPSNNSYCFMLSSLLKMGESDNLEKYFKEWEAGYSIYDHRISNVLLQSYLNRDMIEEAEILNERAQERVGRPNLKACELFSNFYVKRGDINRALKYFDTGSKIAVPGKQNWYPTIETTKMFLEYFEMENDTENAKIFVECMKRFDHVNTAVYKSLLVQLPPQPERLYSFLQVTFKSDLEP